MKSKPSVRQKKQVSTKIPFGRLKIGTKLILLLVFIALLSVGTVGALNYRVGRNIIDEQINQVLSIQTDLTLEAINKMVFDRRNEMQLLISDSTLSNPQASLEEKTKVLKSQLISLGWYDQIHLTDPEGLILASTVSQSIGLNLADEDWFRATSRNFINVSDVVSSPSSEREVLMFTNTLQDENNTVLGFLVAEFSINVIGDLLKSTPENFEAYLITGFGEVITHHAPGLDENPSIDSQGYYQFNPSYLQKQVQSEGYLSFDGNGWSVVVQIPTQIAYQPIRDFTFALVITSLVIAVLVIIAGHFSSRQFVRPILMLTEGVAKMRRGNLKQQVQVNTQDEVGYLAKGFNDMSHDLNEKTQNLIEEKGKYKSILESTNEAIALFDPHHQLIAHNQEFQKLFLKGLRKKKQRSMAEVLAILNKKNVDENSKKAIELIQKIIKSSDFEKSLMLEVTLKKPIYAILTLYAKPVIGEDGRLLGRIWVFNNITEEIESERSKQEFIHVASHKLRTPITTVNWNAQMLLEDSFGKLTKDQKEVIQSIQEASDHLTLLSNILINVANIQKDKIEVRKDIFDLKEMVQGICESLENKVEKSKTTHFKCTLPQLKSIQVKADAKKIKQVILSLLDNAMRYSKDGKKNEVELRLKMDKEAKKVWVSISDTGIGIPEKEQHKMFSKFFRAEKADLFYPDGTGLSLFLAKIILKSSKEKIGFESVAGKGSRFWFTVGLG